MSTVVPPQLLSPGDVVDGTYVVERFLAGGGMGQVYIARDQRLERTVALKLLHPKYSNDIGRFRFRREAQALSCVVHPNVVAVYGFGVHSEGFYLAMEHVRGRPLDEELRSRGALPATEVAALIAQTASGLAEIHAAKIVHRDIKPGNLLVRDTASGTRVVKVVDFGLALAKGLASVAGNDPEAEGQPTRSGVLHILGTPAYMAPEQVVGEEVDGRTDLYALAIVAFEMLTGHLPFQGANIQELLLAQLRQAPPSLQSTAADSRLVPALDDVIGRALAKSAQERYGDVLEFAAALGVACGDASTEGGQACTCPTCGADDARAGGYCHRCGGATPLKRCRVCGTGRSGERFLCVNCGASLWSGSRIAVGQDALVPHPLRASPRRDGGERGAGPAVQGDIGSATAIVLAARISASISGEAALPLLAAFRAVVERADGRVISATGDELLALFGGSGMREGELEIALVAALEVAALAGDGERALAGEGADDVVARLCVGVDEGALWTRAAGHAFGAALALGPAVRAARAAAAIAAPGEVCISDRALGSVRRRFAYEAAGPRMQRVLGHRIVARGPLGASGRHVVAMVGRALELEWLRRSAARSVRDRRMMAVPILGAAGVGKSRLVAEALASLCVDPLIAPRVVQGRCTKSGHVAYEPFVEILRSLINPDRGEDLRDAVRRLPGVAAPDSVQLKIDNRSAALARVLASPSDQSLARPTAAFERGALFEAVVGCIRALAEASPVVVVVEDLHWARSSTLELLTYLIDRVADLPLLLVLPMRPDAGSGLLDSLRMPPARTATLELGPFEPEDTEALVRDLIAPTLPPAALVAHVHRFAEGRPGLVEEAVDALLGEGVLITHEGGDALPVARTDDLEALERGVADLVLRRVGRLAPSERELLWAAAVGGSSAPRGMLAAIVGHSIDDAELRSACDAGYLVEDPNPAFTGETCYRFRQARVAEILLASVAPGRARPLHARALAWLRAWTGVRPSGFGALLAHHALDAGSRDGDTLALLLAGAREALHAFDNRAAFDIFGVALELARDAQLQRVTDPSQDSSPGTVVARDRWQEVDLAAAIEAAIGRAEVATMLGDPAAALEAAERALALAPPVALRRRARALLARANAHRLASAFDAALSDALAAAELAQQAVLDGDGQTLEFVVDAADVVSAHTLLGEPLDSHQTRLGVEGLASRDGASERSGSDDNEADLAGQAIGGVAVEAIGLAAGVELHRGRLAQAKTLAQRAVEMANDCARSLDGGPNGASGDDPVGDELRALWRGEIRALNILGHLAARAGAHDEARANYNAAHALCDAARAPAFANMVDTALGNLAFRAGDLAEAARLYTEVIARSDAIDDRYGAAVARTNLGHVLVENHDSAAALGHLRNAEAVFRSLSAEDNLAETLRLISVALIARGEVQGGRAAASESLELAKHLGNVDLAAASEAAVRSADTVEAGQTATTVVEQLEGLTRGTEAYAPKFRR